MRRTGVEAVEAYTFLKVDSDRSDAVAREPLFDEAAISAKDGGSW